MKKYTEYHPVVIRKIASQFHTPFNMIGFHNRRILTN